MFLSHTSIDISKVMASCGLNPDLLESRDTVLSTALPGYTVLKYRTGTGTLAIIEYRY